MSLALKSKSVKVELFERALEREVAPESEIWLKPKFRLVNVLLPEIALAREAAPGSLISLPLRFKIVKVVLALRPTERNLAPSWPMLLKLKFKLVIAELSERDLDKDSAPESRITNSHRFKVVRVVLPDRFSRIRFKWRDFFKDEGTISKWDPNSRSNRGWRLFLYLAHSLMKEHADFTLLLTSLNPSQEVSRLSELACSVISCKRCIALSSDFETIIPPMKRKTCLNSRKNLASVTLISKSVSPATTFEAR